MAQPANQRMNAAYLPYSIGTLAAYAWQFAEIRDAYTLENFIFLMKDIPTVVEQIRAPYLMAFSCYMWNVKYNLALAQEVKRKYPECRIVFGGPDVPENKTFLEKYDFIDVLIFGEGEEPFYRLLAALECAEPLSTVNSLCYRDGERLCSTPIVTPMDISDYPSPYLEGFFDHILNDSAYADMSFDVVFETNRGCPYKCLYCSWGTKNAPVRKFSMERVKGELEWIARHKIEYCVCADGNFGIFDRDEEIVRYLIAQKKKYGYPITFETTAAKNKNDFVFHINTLLDSAGLNRGVSVACQSLNPEVLKNVHRTRVDIEDFAFQINRYRMAGIATYTDLIMGLPGETLESYCDGLFQVIEAGQHFIQSYRCELLPTSPMASPEIIEKFGIKTVSSSLSEPHTNVHTENKYGARSEVIVQTNTMSVEDWLNMNIIYLYTQTFHGLGILKYMAIYLRRSQQVSYHDFYMKLFKYIEHENTYLKSLAWQVTRSLSEFLHKQTPIRFYDARFGDIYWNLEEGFFNILTADKDAFLKHIKPFLLPFFNDEELFEDLLLYQQSKSAFPFVNAHKESFLYDWESYFFDLYNNSEKQPQKRKNTVYFQSDYYNDLAAFARDTIWYGKRRGKFIVRSVQQDVEK